MSEMNLGINSSTTTKHLMCIGSVNDLSLLSEIFPDRIISSYGFQDLKKVLAKDQPDAVVVVAHEISDLFLYQLSTLRKTLEALSIPLLVMGNNLSTETKRLLLKNGADDCFHSKVNHEGLDRWIEFLKLSKKIGKEKPIEKAESIDFKISFLKRSFDIGVSLIALLLLSPVLIIIATLVRLESKGSIIYAAKRAGSGYKVFNFLKFRTMFVGADAQLVKLKHLNQYGDNQKGDGSVFFKLKDDPRITRIGKFLRNSSLDELPQLINVLKGDMSIVGNRPLPLYEAQMLTKDQAAMRFIAPAGITGLWQVTKRGKKELSDEERIALDIEYANNHTFKNDLILVIKTLPALTQEVAV